MEPASSGIAKCQRECRRDENVGEDRARVLVLPMLLSGDEDSPVTFCSSPSHTSHAHSLPPPTGVAVLFCLAFVLVAPTSHTTNYGESSQLSSYSATSTRTLLTIPLTYFSPRQFHSAEELKNQVELQKRKCTTLTRSFESIESLRVKVEYRLQIAAEENRRWFSGHILSLTAFSSSLLNGNDCEHGRRSRRSSQDQWSHKRLS